MAFFLCIETSTTNCSVALFENNNLVAIKESANGYQHAEWLHSFIQEIITSYPIEKPDAIIVGKGPGSYTGLRIGVAAAKGLCFAWNIPLIAADSLQTLACAVLNSVKISKNDLICPLTDARRMEVYTAFYNHFGERITDIAAKIITENSFSEELKNRKIYFAGDATGKCEPILKNKHAKFIHSLLPSAKYLINEGLKKYTTQQFENMAYFEPFYLKEFVSTTAKKTFKIGE
ncbi:MAG: tRNA (adenosine(37)-N6)-threonylcarbamoyltransferase complex dimerization subunit type 1 TsaB [Bacteroidetes bacterium]|nr:tRNA (adenosine(37)-N6)-threonylcarbamoyltransferase complex dimerization subunit type 1 TsaB [Bacteroidota bacterium]NOG95181.1 tRNA (adenosine(37)-N6)-threonylcarbamoyltransferase complex dimerization subunit type 1 TsaB [Bacteroidota bacterium]GIK69741.1 MAG: tRNA (adenosine(37)-N6)-threonylcarbamoyltransferase complex dimerization subunit type 1 TsaB [Bacteroidota bacterium]CAG0985937.1 tRNA threonylcarbamoyladenosine biosynthesis protein TsaB [Flavobacteriales bacterium]